MHALMADEEAEIEQLLVENRRKQCELRDEEAALTCQLDQLRSARQATAHAERAAAAERAAGEAAVILRALIHDCAE